MLQGGRHGCGLAAVQHNSVWQCACEQFYRYLGDDFFADDIAYGTIRARGGAVDIGFKAGLVGAEFVLDGGLVEVLYPALGGIDSRALLGGVQEGGRIQRNGGFEVQAGAVAVLFVAGVQRDPGVELGIGVDVLGGALCRIQCAASVFVTTAGCPVDVGLYPDVFHAHFGKAPSFDQASVGNAALAYDLLGSFGFGRTAYPVLQLLGADFDGAELVAGGNVGGA